MKEQLVKEATHARLHISEVIFLMQNVNRTREVSLAITNAEEAFMFLGKCKGALGEPSPYPKEKDKASATIADTVTGVVTLEGTEIEVINTIREMLQAIISDSFYNRLFDYFTGVKRFISAQNVVHGYAMTSFMRLTASKMWLGMELNNIMQSDVRDPKDGNGESHQVDAKEIGDKDMSEANTAVEEKADEKK